MLRHPYSRAYSHFLHDKENMPLEKTVVSFEAWLRSFPDNYLTRVICGGHAIWAEQVTESHLNCARRKLNHFTFVMILEQSDLSYSILSLIMGWTERGHLAKRAGLYGETDVETSLNISPESSKLLKAAHYYDVQLYEHGMSLFQSTANRFLGISSPQQPVDTDHHVLLPTRSGDCPHLDLNLRENGFAEMKLTSEQVQLCPSASDYMNKLWRLSWMNPDQGELCY